MVQLEIPADFSVEIDGIGNFCRGGRGTVDRRSCGVGRKIEFVVDVVVVHSSAVIARARQPWSPPSSVTKTDATLLLISMREIRMLWIMGSVV